MNQSSHRNEGHKDSLGRSSTVTRGRLGILKLLKTVVAKRQATNAKAKESGPKKAKASSSRKAKKSQPTAAPGAPERSHESIAWMLGCTKSLGLVRSAGAEKQDSKIGTYSLPIRL